MRIFAYSAISCSLTLSLIYLLNSSHFDVKDATAFDLVLPMHTAAILTQYGWFAFYESLCTN